MMTMIEAVFRRIPRPCFLRTSSVLSKATPGQDIPLASWRFTFLPRTPHKTQSFTSQQGLATWTVHVFGKS